MQVILRPLIYPPGPPSKDDKLVWGPWFCRCSKNQGVSIAQGFHVDTAKSRIQGKVHDGLADYAAV